jgi:hypothetical protein
MQGETGLAPAAEPSQIVLDVLKGQAHNYAKERVYLSVGKWIRTGALPISQVLTALRTHKTENGTAMVSVFDPSLQLFVYLGSDPVNNDFKIPLSLAHEGSVSVTQLLLRFRYPIQHDSRKRLDNTDETAQRTKDRKICYIIEKVALWRNLYNGTVLVQGDRNKLTLEEASMHIGISKKSLDDYLLQLRFGRRHGFNFQTHNTERVGLLRSYVKRTKLALQQVTECKSAESLMDLIEQRFLTERGTESCETPECCRPTAKTILGKVPVEFHKTIAAFLSDKSVL